MDGNFPGISTLIGIFIAAVVNALVLWVFVKSAVSSGAETPKRMKHVWAQTELLIAMARRQGVDAAEIKSITDHLK